MSTKPRESRSCGDAPDEQPLFVSRTVDNASPGILSERSESKDRERWIVDRIEGALVIIEEANGTFSLPSRLLPPGIQEGDVLDVSLGLVVTGEQQEAVRQWQVRLDPGATAERARLLAERRRALGAGDPGGDIIL